MTSQLLVSELTGQKPVRLSRPRRSRRRSAKAVLALNCRASPRQTPKSGSTPAGDVAANVLGFVGSDGKGLGGLEYQYQNTACRARTASSPSSSATTARSSPTASATATQPSPARPPADHRPRHPVEGAAGDRRAGAGDRCGRRIGDRHATAHRPDPGDGDHARPSTRPTRARRRVQDRGNAALSDVFEPGSTNKVITMAAAIDSGVLTPTSPIDVPSTLVRADKVFHDAESPRHRAPDARRRARRVEQHRHDPGVGAGRCHRSCIRTCRLSGSASRRVCISRVRAAASSTR